MTPSPKKLKSKVNIQESNEGYLIEITDSIFDPVLYAVTHEELEQIVLYGQIILTTPSTGDK